MITKQELRKDNPLVAKLIRGGAIKPLDVAYLFLRTGRAAIIRWTLEDYLPKTGEVKKNRAKIKDIIIHHAALWDVTFPTVYGAYYNSKRAAEVMPTDAEVKAVSDILVIYAPGTTHDLWAGMAKWCFPNMQKVAAACMLMSCRYTHKEVADKTGASLTLVNRIKLSLPW